MKAAIFHGPFHIDVEDVSVPEIGNHDVLVKTKFAGICGSDLHTYRGKLKIAKPPRVLGHELSGIVYERGKEVNKFQINERVVVEPLLGCGRCPLCASGRYNICKDYKLIGVHLDGGFAEFVRVPKGRIHRIPEGISFEEGVMIEPSAVAFHAVRLARIRPDDHVAVIGAGVVGLQILQIAKIFGAEVMIADLLDYKLELAKKLGADVTVNAAKKGLVESVADSFGSLGADVVFEASGEAIGQTTDLIRPGGKIVLVGLGPEYVPMDVRKQVLYEYNIVGSHTYCGDDFPRVISLASEGKLRLRELITHRFPLENIKEAFEILDKGIGNPIKVILNT